MASVLPTDRVTFDTHYGLDVVEASPDLMVGRCPVTDRVLMPFGLVHGGVFASMAESLASIGTLLGVHEAGNIGVGQSNATTFVRPIREGTIHATARPRHRGRRTWVWDVEVSDDAGELCALSRVTIAVRPARRD